ncbi:complement factor D isoform X2 [Sorex araneus]|uniref:complement factor D isoform X2 n=1 Tax=Sorex araneus TaxID=42254 RepID=UPI002433F0C4|nr:complement factor D isoform X2 [Sorex araneus]
MHRGYSWLICSGITPGGAQGTIWDAGNRTRVSRVCYRSSSFFLFLKGDAFKTIIIYFIIIFREAGRGRHTRQCSGVSPGSALRKSLLAGSGDSMQCWGSTWVGISPFASLEGLFGWDLALAPSPHHTPFPPPAAQPRGRILGGSEAQAHARPYMASVQVNGSHQCGGFLMNEQWVMSAAHCWDNKTQLQVLLGAHSLSEPEPSKRLYDVLRAVPHPGSHQDTNDHDLLLLQLSEKAELGPAVQPLPWKQEAGILEAGTVCDVAGWGVIRHTGSLPDRLQYLKLPVMDRDTCNHRRYYDGTITEHMLCVESDRRRDSCKGDSGGPLVCGGVAEGVLTSGARVCGNPKKPSVFTSVSTYVDWIKSVLNETATVTVTPTE